MMHLLEMLEEALKVSLFADRVEQSIVRQSIKVSLIAVSLEQLIYLFLTRCCLLPIPPRTLQRHPCPLGRQNYLNKDVEGLKGPGTDIGKKKRFFHFFPQFFLETRAEELFNGGTGRRLADGAGEERVGSSGRNP